MIRNNPTLQSNSAREWFRNFYPLARLFPVQLMWFAFFAFNTEEASMEYSTKDAQAADIDQLDKC
jgi:hypothetical protein